MLKMTPTNVETENLFGAAVVLVSSSESPVAPAHDTLVPGTVELCPQRAFTSEPSEHHLFDDRYSQPGGQAVRELAQLTNQQHSPFYASGVGQRALHKVPSLRDGRRAATTPTTMAFLMFTRLPSDPLRTTQTRTYDQGLTL